MNKQINHTISAFMLFILLAIFARFTFVFLTSQKNISSTELNQTSKLVTPVALSEDQIRGQTIFRNKCASCHILFRDATGPSLLNFEARGPWGDRKNVYAWIKDPAAFMNENEYARELKKNFGGTIMTAFPDLTHEEIDAICNYLKQWEEIQSMPVAFK